MQAGDEGSVVPGGRDLRQGASPGGVDGVGWWGGWLARMV